MIVDPVFYLYYWNISSFWMVLIFKFRQTLVVLNVADTFNCYTLSNVTILKSYIYLLWPKNIRYGMPDMHFFLYVIRFRAMLYTKLLLFDTLDSRNNCHNSLWCRSALIYLHTCSAFISAKISNLFIKKLLSMPYDFHPMVMHEVNFQQLYFWLWKI